MIYIFWKQSWTIEVCDRVFCHAKPMAGSLFFAGLGFKTTNNRNNKGKVILLLGRRWEILYCKHDLLKFYN